MIIVDPQPRVPRPAPFFNSAPNFFERSRFSPWSGTRTASGFGGTSRREDDSFGSSSSPSSDGTQTASGFGGTSRREDDSFGSSSSSSSDGTQTASAFGGTSRR